MSNENDSLNKVVQITTSFPNQNEKQIDYVIVYKDNENNKNLEYKDAVREEFFQKLRQENVEVNLIEFKTDNEIHVYAIIHCSNERLMLEAEKIKLPVQINSVIFFEFLVWKIIKCLYY
jgi:hypothetical protein